MRARQYLLESSSGFPMTPMIDVVLQLLIFFMLISRYLPPALNVTLPEASTARAEDRPSISISITSDGTLAVDGAITAWPSLPGLLAGREPETLVRVAADRGADYGLVVRALDASAAAGLTHIALETAPQPPPAK